MATNLGAGGTILRMWAVSAVLCIAWCLALGAFLMGASMYAAT